MGGYNFLLTIGRDLNRIKNIFRKGLEKYNVAFDEDIFSDTMLKCAEKLNEKAIEDDTTSLKYFWTSFKNNSLKICEREKSKFENIDDTNVACIIDETYDDRMDITYDIIVNSVSEQFGKELCDLWMQHIINDKTYEELGKITEIDNLHYRFRKIRNYVRSELIIANNEFKEIIKELY